MREVKGREETLTNKLSKFISIQVPGLIIFDCVQPQFEKSWDTALNMNVLLLESRGLI